MSLSLPQPHAKQIAEPDAWALMQKADQVCQPLYAYGVTIGTTVSDRPPDLLKETLLG